MEVARTEVECGWADGGKDAGSDASFAERETKRWKARAGGKQSGGVGELKKRLSCRAS